jgi:predicted naringenin-chalcone synthase
MKTTMISRQLSHVFLHALQTWNPPVSYSQQEASEEVQAQFEDKKTKRILRHIYKQSAIDKRHTAVGTFGQADPGALFHDRGDGRWHDPETGDRNRKFMEVSKQASVELARNTLDAAPDFDASDITHIITASCTGFYNPGPDYHIIRELGLPPSTERFNLGYMGCYAAFPALRMARTICQQNPDAVVMIQCLELCSLHLQLNPDNPEALVAGSLFADGAGCALVSARPPKDRPAYRIDHLCSTLTPTGEDSMAWEVGNHGYEIVLSGYVPHILGENIRGTIQPGLEQNGWSLDDIGFWCVHPGGKAILDRVGEALDLSPDALDVARHVLRNFGNMSSATIFFLLQQGLDTFTSGTKTAAMAFGPGLTVEMGFLEVIGQ